VVQLSCSDVDDLGQKACCVHRIVRRPFVMVGVTDVMQGIRLQAKDDELQAVRARL
jgi:hypothetical protein